MAKTGILGGTFNPPHNAHIMMADEAVSKLCLDRILFMPNGLPPHKRTGVSVSDRLAMARLAAMETNRITGKTVAEVCEIEANSPEPSYLADSLLLLSEMYKGDSLYFIVGCDALSGMASWKSADRIFETAAIAGFERNGMLGLSAVHAAAYLRKRGANVILIDSALPQVSSSDIREKLGRGEIPVGELPDSILKYIIENNLYYA